VAKKKCEKQEGKKDTIQRCKNKKKKKKKKKNEGGGLGDRKARRTDELEPIGWVLSFCDFGGRKGPKSKN